VIISWYVAFAFPPLLKGAGFFFASLPAVSPFSLLSLALARLDCGPFDSVASRFGAFSALLASDTAGASAASLAASGRILDEADPSAAAEGASIAFC